VRRSSANDVYEFSPKLRGDDESSRGTPDLRLTRWFPLDLLPPSRSVRSMTILIPSFESQRVSLVSSFRIEETIAAAGTAASSFPSCFPFYETLALVAAACSFILHSARRFVSERESVDRGASRVSACDVASS